MNTVGAIVAAIVLVYLIDVALWPVRRCWVCGGTGWLRSPLTGGMRPCDGCTGGKRTRWAWLRRGARDD